MPTIKPEIISSFKEFWDRTNKDALFGITYPKSGVVSAEEAGLLKPWMEGQAEWIFARSVLYAHKTGDITAITDALDIMEHNLNQEEYAGVGYPIVSLDTGAGCIAGFITEHARYYNQTVWYELPQPWDYSKILSIKPDHTTDFAKVTMEAVSLAANRFKGKAILAPLDLGGLADILSSLRRTDGIMYDMYDNPDEVKESLRLIYSIWMNFHNQMIKIMEPANEGLYTSWTRVLSDNPYFPSQCDANALISPQLFDEFFWPTLSDEFSVFTKTLYHLDGSGQIPHLDTLFTNPSLRIIQWVPEPGTSHFDPQYFPLYNKIIANDRGIVFNCNTFSLEKMKKFFEIFPREPFYITAWAKDYEEAMGIIH